MVTGNTKLNVSATGGNTTGSGSTDNANTNAIGLATILYTEPYPILGDMTAGKDTQIYGELTKYIGQLTSNIQFNIGARWKI